jgi:hypothetical protein
MADNLTSAAADTKPQSFEVAHKLLTIFSAPINWLTIISW